LNEPKKLKLKLALKPTLKPTLKPALKPELTLTPKLTPKLKNLPQLRRRRRRRVESFSTAIEIWSFGQWLEQRRFFSC